MDWQSMILFFRENRELFFFLGSALIAIFAEGGRRQYKRMRAAQCAAPEQSQQLKE